MWLICTRAIDAIFLIQELAKGMESVLNPTIKPKWWGHNPDHRVTKQEVCLLPSCPNHVIKGGWHKDILLWPR